MNYTLKRQDVAGCWWEIERGSFERVAEHYLEHCERHDDELLIEIETEDDVIDFLDEMTAGQIDAALPRYLKEWCICDRCRGEGTCLIDGLEGVAFSAEEFNDAFDPDEQERYFTGGYDRPCPNCNGTGKLLLVDEERLERVAPRLSRLRRAWIEDEYEMERLYEAERRMGA